jgi:DNA-binding PadR family transcriptional regulator
MIVFGLLSIGMRYGWQMEKFAAETEMRQWTPIGMSTIYKLLKDMAREGAVKACQEEGAKGPGRVSYSLTVKGRREFQTLIAQALRSNASVYSERMAGLVFLPTVDNVTAMGAIDDADSWLSKADDMLSERRRAQGDDVIADALIGFYRDVYAAERKALAKVNRLLGGPRSKRPATSRSRSPRQRDRSAQ